MNRIRNMLRGLMFFALSLVPCMNAYAGTLNPSTGDNAGRYIWVVAVVAAVALVAAIISGLTSKKKK